VRLCIARTFRPVIAASPESDTGNICGVICLCHVKRIPPAKGELEGRIAKAAEVYPLQ
jgi:hypothetical protein